LSDDALDIIDTASVTAAIGVRRSNYHVYNYSEWKRSVNAMQISDVIISATDAIKILRPIIVSSGIE
jgi:hypothetical protein